jgi:hypothetical protein
MYLGEKHTLKAMFCQLTNGQVDEVEHQILMAAEIRTFFSKF